VVFQLFEHVVSTENPFHWLILVGALLIAIVIFAPRGIGHAVRAGWERFRVGRQAA
jgi:branched-chain amino acid transport system permease protein